MRKDHFLETIVPMMFCAAIRFVIGIIVGVTVGWMLGIMSAPQSGHETREALAEHAIELHGRSFAEEAPAE